uniref:Uncharacterized protein n=1 Tax=uncultured Chloroflexota bacterium TaxID=166587 RepID=H5SCW3_9CHLR|nr:hypothetical protein HGMM_F11H08C09 [uncultured Chloroflexota bacterium]
MKRLSLPDEQTIRAYIEKIYTRGVKLAKTKIELHSFLQEEIAALATDTNYSLKDRVFLL